MYPLEEGPDTLAFASEPIFANLASLLASQPHPHIPDGLEKAGVDQHPIFLDVELKYGILQVIFLTLF